MKRWPTAIVGAAGEHRERTFSLSVLRMVGGRTAGKVVGTVQAFSLPAAFRIAVRIPSVS